MKLSDRWMSCDCGNEMDRDENAARNIEAEGNRLCVELDTNLSVLPDKQAVKRVPKIMQPKPYGTAVAFLLSGKISFFCIVLLPL